MQRFVIALCLRPTWDPLQQKDVRGPANLEALSKWTCKGCGESQYHTYMKCSKCNTYKPPEADLNLRSQVCQIGLPSISSVPLCGYSGQGNTQCTATLQGKHSSKHSSDNGI